LAPKPLQSSQQQRAQIVDQIAQLDDLRPGSITSTSGRCGKPNCRCQQPNQPPHGPTPRLTFKVEGKTVTESLPDSAALRKAKREVAECRKFERLSREFVDVNAQICHARPVEEQAQTPQEKNCRRDPARGRARGRATSAHHVPIWVHLHIFNLPASRLSQYLIQYGSCQQNTLPQRGFPSDMLRSRSADFAIRTAANNAAAIKRTAESIGTDIAAQEQAEIARAKQLVLPVVSKQSIPKLYVLMDGTGVPVVAAETEGRTGKIAGAARPYAGVQTGLCLHPNQRRCRRQTGSRSRLHYLCRSHLLMPEPSNPPRTSAYASTPRLGVTGSGPRYDELDERRLPSLLQELQHHAVNTNKRANAAPTSTTIENACAIRSLKHKACALQPASWRPPAKYQDYPGVEMLPGRLSGEPVPKGTRVPAKLVAECLDDGETVQEIDYNYSLNLLDVLKFKTFRDTNQRPGCCVAI
jgi:uncharacterized protein (DUF433 family)